MIVKPDDVRQRVVEIEEVGDSDYERAHSLEDALYKDILEAIREDRCYAIQACAREALKSQDIDFRRVSA